LDDGSISQEDIINAVEYPPKVNFNSDDDKCDKFGFKYGFAIDLNYKGFETKKPIEYASASELFEIIWGKKRA
jgi:hypothetical protein